jgi:hypothetical protein
VGVAMTGRVAALVTAAKAAVLEGSNNAHRSS